MVRKVSEMRVQIFAMFVQIVEDHVKNGFGFKLEEKTVSFVIQEDFDRFVFEHVPSF